MKFPIYLDYASTTPVDSRVVNKMMKYLSIKGIFGNPASRSHKFGWEAEEAVDISRIKISKLIHCQPEEIIFTSGATESNNLAIKGIANFFKKKGNHIITSQTEHKSVLDSCRFLETKGFKITYIKPNKFGIISLKKIKEKISKNTILITIMHVNNETGIIQDIKNIGKLCLKNNIFFHVDATQSIGKISINMKKKYINLMSFSAHKIYGPKGIGVLYIRKQPRIRLTPLIHGGGHERGMRSGTLPVHQIVGMAKACTILKNTMKKENKKIKILKKLLWKKISKIKEINLNSLNNNKKCIPNILNVSFKYIEGESLIMSLKNLGISSGSACTSESLEPSYVLRSMGLNDELAHSSIRFSLGRFTNKEEIKYTSKILKKSVSRLRKISPLWEMYQSGIDINSINWNLN